MNQRNTNRFLTRAARGFFAAFAVLLVSAGAAFADDINLNMEGSGSATIPKGNTVTRRIFNIPSGIPGTLRLKMKWHAVSIIPNTFNQLKVEIKHGSQTLATRNCYSVHSNKTPKCDFLLNISTAEANYAGNWTLEVTNNSGDEVIGFDIAKNGDVNPAVPNFKSVYTPDCPDTVNLDMEGTTATITKGGTVTRTLSGIGKSAGVLRLRAKWHAVHIVPNTFNALRIELLDPSGSVVAASSGNYFSIHSDKTPKFDITYNIPASQAQESGSWRLRVTNNSSFEVIGFNITKESGDVNPTVPRFNSTYKASCP